MAHSLPHNLKNFSHSQITTAHRHLSMYVHIFSWSSYADCDALYRFFICLKPDTKRCKPHDTPSTWPLEDQESYMSFSLADSFLPWEKHTHKTLFPVAHQEHSSTEQHSTVALRYSRCRLTAWFLLYEILRGLYEICTRSGFCKARQQGKAAGIFSTLPLSALRLSNHFSSSIRFSSLLFCI